MLLEKPQLELVGEGRQRTAYLTRTNKYVIKVPTDGYGELANSIEATDYRENRFFGKEKLGRCRTFFSKKLEKVCLIMEFITPALNREELPDWTSYIDCGQVGYNKDGILKAYDWAQT
jgi:hypothetical protein